MSDLNHQPKPNNMKSLAALAALKILNEADLFLDEMQAGLNSIVIQGGKVDELWCVLDWHSYILKLWVKQTREKHQNLGHKWRPIVETWYNIIEATVELVVKYASDRPPRSAVLKKKNSLMFLPLTKFMDDDETSLSRSITDRSSKCNWDASLLASKKYFKGLIDNVKKTIESNHSKEKLESHRRYDIESLEFQDYIEEVEENVVKLIYLLPAEETKELCLVIVNALKAALGKLDIWQSIPYLQLIQTLKSKWLPNKSTLLPEFNRLYQEQIQWLFGRIIEGCSHTKGYGPDKYTVHKYTAKDLEDVIALGADIRGQTLGGEQDCCLFSAADNECPMGIFKALVKAGAPYSKNFRDQSPLHAAAKADRIDILKFLLKSREHSLNVNINDVDVNSRTALHAAARTCNEKAIGLLLQHPDIEAEIMDSDGYTPFLTAVNAAVPCQDKRAVVQRFINFKRGNSFQPSRNRENALHLAAGFRDATFSILIRYVKDVNAQDWRGETPLHKAVRAKSRPNVEMLLRNGADPAIASVRGYTPLQFACSQIHLGTMEALLSLPQSCVKQWPHPKDINILNSMFISSPITVIFQDYDGSSRDGLKHARRALKMILAARPDLEACGTDGRSVLSRIITIVDSERVMLDLLRAGADVNTQDKRGDTPLHILLSLAPDIDYRKFELLLEWGADPGINNKNGQDPIAANSIPQFVQPWEKEIAAIIKRNEARIAKAQGNRKGLSTEAKPQKAREQEVEIPSVPSTNNPYSALVDNEES